MVLRQLQGTAAKLAGGAGRSRPATALTFRSIEALKPGPLPYRVPDARCKGLAVRVSESGALTWDLAFRIKGTGKVRRLSLGRFPEISLDAARNRANAITTAARAGRDLVIEQKTAREEADARITVERLIDTYVKRRVAGRLRTAKEIESRLKRALATHLARPAEDIRRRDIRVVLDEVADRGALREAEKQRQSVGAMFRWAIAQDFVEADPTAGLTGYDAGTPRERVLSAIEIKALWGWLDGSGMPSDHADVLRLQLALGARCGEIAGMRAGEIDRHAWLWALPADRSKNGKSRVTPLVGIAREIIERRLAHTSRGPLFMTETRKPLTSAHVGHAISTRRKRCPVAVFTSHDLRRTMATQLVDMAVPLDLVAAVIGHEAGGREVRTLVRHYVKSDHVERKRTVFEGWDRRLRSILEPASAADNVTSKVPRLWRKQALADQLRG